MSLHRSWGPGGLHVKKGDKQASPLRTGAGPAGGWGGCTAEAAPGQEARLLCGLSVPKPARCAECLPDGFSEPPPADSEACASARPALASLPHLTLSSSSPRREQSLRSEGTVPWGSGSRGGDPGPLPSTASVFLSAAVRVGPHVRDGTWPVLGRKVPAGSALAGVEFWGFLASCSY